MEPNSGIKPWQWAVTIIVILIIVGLGGYLVYRGKNSTSNAPTGGIEEASPTPFTTATTNRVSLTDQFPGNIVYLGSASFTQPGFAVVHKDDKGKPGAVIGSTYFEAGTRPGSINLTEKTVEGKTYYVMLHMDDGDKIFDITKDTPITGDDGKPVMQSFKATTNLPEDKG